MKNLNNADGCFGRLKSYDLKDLDHPTDNVVVHCAKVQIVIISHHFLQRLKDESSRRPRLSPINRVFRSKSVIAVLLAVSADEVLDSYESGKIEEKDALSRQIAFKNENLRNAVNALCNSVSPFQLKKITLSLLLKWGYIDSFQQRMTKLWRLLFFIYTNVYMQTLILYNFHF